MDIAERIALDIGEDAIALHTLTKTDLEGYLTDAETLAEGWVRSCGFKADRGDICKLPADDGSLSAILVGLGDDIPSEEDPWWLAAVASELQEGTYRLEGDLPAGTLASAARGWCLAASIIFSCLFRLH